MTGGSQGAKMSFEESSDNELDEDESDDEGIFYPQPDTNDEADEG